MKLEITHDQYLEIEKFHLEVFSPLKTFMNEQDFLSCVNEMKLSNGELFPIPIIFDLNESNARKFEKSSNVELFYDDEHVADLKPTSIYSVNKGEACKKIFGTESKKHPGAKYFKELNKFFVSGEIELYKRPEFSFSKYELTPDQVKKEIKRRGWKKIVGFQTRNIPHRAHEYLQKVALEHSDGILIQPIVGFKKSGDFTPEAVIAAYKSLINNYYPKKRVIFCVLSTIMRYAGPREAIFHALVRRNYGCTDFIIGRDHAGVGNFYKKYAAHDLASKLQNKLDIRIMNLLGPYYCNICDGIVTEKTCPHKKTEPSECYDINGTDIRNSLNKSTNINPKFIRKSVIDSLKNINEPFVK